jgi:hypothetical protein
MSAKLEPHVSASATNCAVTDACDGGEDGVTLRR